MAEIESTAQRVGAAVMAERELDEPHGEGISGTDHVAPPRPWIASGWLAIAVAIAVAFALREATSFPTGVAVIVGIACGWLAFLIAAPWWWVRRLNADRETIRRLAVQLRSIDLAARRDSLDDVLLKRNDELGELSRAIHDCLTQALASRAEARMLQRNMRHSIERQTRQATAKLERATLIDPLTGIGNRRALEQAFVQLREEAKASAAFGPRRHVIAAIDMDRFKEINDALGHDAGDQCLIFLADLLRSMTRSSDHVVRLGGDEFIVVLRESTLAGAAGLASRVQSLFAQMPWSCGERVPRPTLSIGLAEGAAEGASLGDVLRRADAALYRAKRNGRNCFACDGDDGQSASAA